MSQRVAIFYIVGSPGSTLRCGTRSRDAWTRACFALGFDLGLKMFEVVFVLGARMDVAREQLVAALAGAGHEVAGEDEPTDMYATLRMLDDMTIVYPKPPFPPSE